MRNTLILTALIGATAISGFALASERGDRGGERHGHRGSPEERVTMIMERFDADGDGQITVEEVEAYRAARFEAADTNGDGVIDEAEFQAAAEARAMERVAERAGEMFARIDEDGDGQLTQDDVSGREGRLFEHADENGDGILTEDELLNERPNRR
ncbi:MAG: EF-hand domain-containing protein [Pseudomonadota bacterium]